MIIKNVTIDEIIKKGILKEKIILFGKGLVLSRMQSCTSWRSFTSNISYIIDNNFSGQINFCGRQVSVFSPDKIRSEENCSIIITSAKYALEMLEQLEEMNLPDSVECYVWRGITGFSFKLESLPIIGQSIFSIPKIIHTFWFSGEKIPDEYQKCIDSWSKYCPDYEIKIWTQNNYDCSKNTFLQQAIKSKKWAFAADFARFDVLYEYGGIYMDSDVELFKSLNDFLHFESFFPFTHSCLIDPVVFGTIQHNPLLKQLLKQYENRVLFNKSGNPDTIDNFLPSVVCSVFEDMGFNYNDTMQMIDGNLIVPSYYFSNVYFEITRQLFPETEKKLYSIHHCESGWCDVCSSTDEYNKKLFSKIFNREFA